MAVTVGTLFGIFVLYSWFALGRGLRAAFEAIKANSNQVESAKNLGILMVWDGHFMSMIRENDAAVNAVLTCRKIIRAFLWSVLMVIGASSLLVFLR